MIGLPPKPPGWPHDWPEDIVAEVVEGLHQLTRIGVSSPPAEWNAKPWQELKDGVTRRLAQRRNGHAQSSVPPRANQPYVEATVSGELASLAAAPKGARNGTLDNVALRTARVLPFDAGTRQELRNWLTQPTPTGWFTMTASKA